MQSSVLATNSHYSYFYNLSQTSSFISILTNLTSPATLFVPTNVALELSQAAHNVSTEQTETFSVLSSALGYYVVPDQAIMVCTSTCNSTRLEFACLYILMSTLVLQNVSSLQDDQVLTTLDPGGNLTVYQNGSQTFLDSYGAEAMVIGPPAYACNVSVCCHNDMSVLKETVAKVLCCKVTPNCHPARFASWISHLLYALLMHV